MNGTLEAARKRFLINCLNLGFEDVPRRLEWGRGVGRGIQKDGGGYMRERDRGTEGWLHEQRKEELLCSVGEGGEREGAACTQINIYTYTYIYIYIHMYICF